MNVSCSRKSLRDLLVLVKIKLYQTPETNFLFKFFIHQKTSLTQGIYSFILKLSLTAFVSRTFPDCQR